jgi:two-component system cell cycle sensor histidine kinase/response regulator CckA
VETRNRLIGVRDIAEHPFLAPGEYVELVVEDNGCGMSAEVASHIFEPFFTTKEPGKGTGLGLSTVYGIVKQSNGHVLVDSREGEGSRFQILLPRAGEPPRQEPVPDPGNLMPGLETILLAEDEDAVRIVARRFLERSGYTVLEARDGEEALGILQQYGRRVDLLLTDVVMPRMSGPALAERVLVRQPEIGILFMSGYPNGALGDGSNQPGAAFVQKPFAPQLLLRRVRETLDRRIDKLQPGRVADGRSQG